jgi:branched-chain amino acid transport system permease protein
MDKWRGIVLVLIALVLVLLPLLPFGTKDNLTLMISLFMVASLASSWNILAGFVGRINLGHVAFFGLGSLTTRQLWLVYEWHLVPAFILGGIVAALAAVIVGIPALRLKGIYFSVGTLAMAEALRLTIGNVLPGVSRLPGPMLRSYNDTFASRYYVSLAVMLLIVATVFWLRRSKLGLGMMAIREDEEAARSIGINVLQHSMIAFIMSAFFAGLTGSTFAYYHQSYYPSLTFGPVWTFDALLVTFIGGIGTLSGPLVGAVFFVLVRDILAANLVNFHLIIFGIIFIFMVLVLPGGFVDVIAHFNRSFRRTAIKPTTQENIAHNLPPG